MQVDYICINNHRAGGGGGVGGRKSLGKLSTADRGSESYGTPNVIKFMTLFCDLATPVIILQPFHPLYDDFFMYYFDLLRSRHTVESG